MRRRSLGKGLGELIATDALPQNRVIVDLPLDRISPNPRQPRVHMDPDKLEELTLSIEAHGVLQPIIVRQTGDTYEIIAGERRWRAAQRAGLSSVPCIVQQASEENSLGLALVENLQRDDLNAIEAARGYRRLVEEFGFTQERVSQLVGKSRSAVANTLRLLDLPRPIQDAIHQGLLTEGHGRALLGLAGNPQAMLDAWRQVQDQHLSVRDTEQLVRETLSPQPQPPAAPASRPPVDPNLRDAQERIQQALAAKVHIHHGSRGNGRIVIHYADNEDFHRLLEHLCSRPSGG